jgi:hypothetical protein
MGLSAVAVVIDCSDDAAVAVKHAAALAREHKVPLTIIAVVPRVAIIDGLAGIAGVCLGDVIEADGRRRLREITSDMPRDRSCTTVLLTGNIVGQTRRYLRDHAHDALVVGFGHPRLTLGATWLAALRLTRRPPNGIQVVWPIRTSTSPALGTRWPEPGGVTSWRTGGQG